ncbi:MAG TPA: HAD family phosphatase [Candidatus Saccharimonadales bacterium]|nr:HAD family phosphatase [Candidatus Saccharimonadales bacterium]
MNSVEAILLDMNGVLVNDEHLHEEAFAITFEDSGLSLQPEDYKAYFAGRTDKEGVEAYLAAKGSNIPADKIVLAKSQRYIQLSSEGVQDYEGVREFVERAVRRGIKVAVVTSAPRNEASSLLESIGIARYLATSVTAEDVNNGKPSPEGYLKAAERLQIDPAKCLVVEDAPSGILAAKKAGMMCVAVSNTHTPDELIMADEIVPQLSEISFYLDY